MKNAMDSRLEGILKEFKAGVEGIYGDRLLRMVLFGSQARGEAETGSDIDVLVVLQGQVDPGREIARTGQFKADFCLKHDRLISCLYMSDERYENEHSPLLLNIRREGQIL